MTLSSQQKVYIPTAGKALEAPWGAAAAESVVQKFATQTERNTRWPQPVASGSVCATQSDDTLWFSDGAKWIEVVKTDGATFSGVVSVASPLEVRGTDPYIEWATAAGARYGYMQHEGTGFNHVLQSTVGWFRFITGGATSGAPAGDPVERFRITGASPAGVRVTGVTKSTAYVQVGGDGPQVRIVDTNMATGSADAFLGFYAKGTVDAPGARGGYVGFAGSGYLRVTNEATSSSSVYSAPYAHAFYLANVEQARFYGGNPGYFVFSKTSVNQAVTGVELSPAGTITLTRSDSAAGLVVNKEAAGASSHFADFRGDTVNWGLIHRNGSGAGVKYRETSDGRWKDNVTELDGDAALTRMKQLRPVQYQWKFDAQGRPSEQGTPTGETHTGFIAQELAEIVPEAVLPGYGTEAEHWAWVGRLQEHYDAELAFQAAMDAGGMDAGETLTPPQSLTAEDLIDPYRPWMSSLSDVVPDLVAAMRVLIARVEALEAA